MKKRIAVYAASLDPITNGHINVIERMAPLYDVLVVVVASDPRKTYSFTTDERADMARVAVAHLSNVEVQTSSGQYIVRYASAIGAQVIIRGLRNFKDLEDEQTLAEENRKIVPEIETIWVPCLPNLMHVSSSMVKGHVGLDPTWSEQVARSVPEVVVKKLKEKYLLHKARLHWQVFNAASDNKEVSNSILNDLLTRYNEPHRKYHNLTHIVSMLDELETVASDPMLSLAVWFHDSIYDTKAKDNEEKSAKLAREAVEKMGLNSGLGDDVEELILVTKHPRVPANDWEKIMIDLDLAILARPEKEFDEYEAGIREEYSWVPEIDFREARGAFLQSLLDAKVIYWTEVFQEKYDSAARKNLKRSIENLLK